MDFSEPSAKPGPRIVWFKAGSIQPFTAHMTQILREHCDERDTITYERTVR